jgi:ATP-dependent Lon protease
VGGIKEKLLAAHRSGMRHVIVPKDNEADLVKLPQTVRDDIKLTLVSHLDEVFSAVFG